MLPGLTRTAAQPASIAAKMYFGWKWMSAITGMFAFFAIAAQRVGVLLTRARDPDDVAAGRGQLGDLLQRGVDVVRLGGAHRLHRDGVVAADTDVADHQLTSLSARRQAWARAAPACRVRRSHELLSYWNGLIGLTKSAVTVSAM